MSLSKTVVSVMMYDVGSGEIERTEVERNVADEVNETAVPKYSYKERLSRLR